MALTNPPGFLQNAGNTHTAAQLRTYLAGLQAGGSPDASSLRARGGINPTLGLQFIVTQTGSPSMAVLVESGVASIPGTQSSTQGNYFVTNDAQVTLSIAAAHATLPRIDIVVINVRDQQYSGASNDSQLQVITGTPASSPVAPTAPDNSLTIGQVAIAAAATSITNANITDTRRYLAGAGGIINASSDANRPATSEIQDGQFVYTLDNKKLYFYNGTAYRQIWPISGSATGPPIHSYWDQASGLLNLVTSITDVPGLSITFTTNAANAVVVVMTVFDMEAIGATVTNGVGIINVDGVDGSANGVLNAVFENTGSTGRASIALNDRFVLTSAGSHTIKARGFRSGGVDNQIRINNTHTTMTIMVFEV